MIIRPYNGRRGLAAVMYEGAVRLRHAVQFVLTAHCGTFATGSVHEFVGQPTGHAHAVAAPGRLE